jgi:hypothetical protein
MKDYSQNGEQKKLIDLFNVIGRHNKFCVEFGAADGVRCSNTKYFVDEEKWDYVYWDIEPASNIVSKEIVTSENVNRLFAKYNIPYIADLVSIDVNGIDYWIWKSLYYKPRVVIIEFNPSIAKDRSWTIEYDSKFVFDNTSYFGASFLALKTLGVNKGYTLVDATSLNMIFTQNEIATKFELTNEQVDYKIKRGWPMYNTKRKWVEV